MGSGFFLTTDTQGQALEIGNPGNFEVTVSVYVTFSDGKVMSYSVDPEMEVGDQPSPSGRPRASGRKEPPPGDYTS